MTDFNRRASDALGDDIEDMIRKEDDHKQRAFLIVLNSINHSLRANTAAISATSDKLDGHLRAFEEHQRSEDARLNQGRGAWRVAAWVLGMAQMAGLGIWAYAHDEIRSINSAQQSVRQELANIRTLQEVSKLQFDQVTKRLDRIEGRTP